MNSQRFVIVSIIAPLLLTLSVFLAHNHNKIDINDTHNEKREMSQNKGGKVKLPYFVLHAGPGKTGTSFLQSAANNMLKNDFKTDGYVYIGNGSGVLRRNTLLTGDGHGNKTWSKRFVDMLLTQKKLGNNIFGSSEMWNSPSIEECKAWKEMSKDTWDLRIVLTYRRLHDILPSHWNQSYKKKRNHGRRTSHHEHNDWPGVNGDYRILTFNEWYVRSFYNPKINGLKTIAAYNRWKECADEIKFVNYHVKEDENFVTEFFCEALPGETQTCSNLKKVDQKSTHTSNPSSSLDYDILAVRAYEKGLVDPSFKRQFVGEKVQYHVMKHNITLPQRCPNAAVLDFMYENSYEDEEWALSAIKQSKENANNNGKIDIVPMSKDEIYAFNSDWEKQLADKKLCNVDADQALEQDRWQKFFEDYFNSEENISRA